MNKINKKEIFKFLIKEFLETDLPDVIKRDLEVPVSAKKVVTIFGPRRSGKSFYFYGLIANILASGIPKDRTLYLNFEDDRILPLTYKDLNDLMEAYFELYPENKNKKIFLFFDEIQNIEKWEIFIRRIYDKEKASIFVTGSSSKLLSREIATALRGRTLSFPLYPLNFREFLRFRGEELKKDFEYTEQRYRVKKLLGEFLEFGGFPEIVLTEGINLKRKILKEYFDLLVYRDLVERFSMKNMELLKDILDGLFADITSLFSVNAYYKSVKQFLRISRATISEYLEYIKETDYFILLPRFSYSLKEQRVNPKKIICIDNGLRNRMAFRFSKDFGKLAENLVGGVLVRKNNDTYYWQDKGEVDFAVNIDGRLEAVNVSFGEKIEKRETDSLLEFANKFKFKKVKKITLITKDTDKQEGAIRFVPLYKWLLEN